MGLMHLSCSRNLMLHTNYTDNPDNATYLTSLMECLGMGNATVYTRQSPFTFISFQPISICLLDWAYCLYSAILFFVSGLTRQYFMLYHSNIKSNQMTWCERDDIILQANAKPFVCWVFQRLFSILCSLQ